MVEDEDMAVRFYKTGDSDDLANQLTAILKSPGLQRQMAQHNFAAGVDMTMTTVVNNYLRWFELNRCKREIRSAGALRERQRMWLRSLRDKKDSPGRNVHSLHLNNQNDFLSPAGYASNLDAETIEPSSDLFLDEAI
jgi:hypothetical protein